MKVTVIGSHLCPDTLYALNRLSEARAEIDFKNLSASLADLKVYLALRQDSPVYADIREGGGIGIPCFVLEDGTVTRDLEAVLQYAGLILIRSARLWAASTLHPTDRAKERTWQTPCPFSVKAVIFCLNLRLRCGF